MGNRIVSVPGVGPVEFPEHYTDADIGKAIDEIQGQKPDAARVSEPPDRRNYGLVEGAKELPGNIPGSVLKQLQGVAQAGSHPVDTLKSMLSIAGLPVTLPAWAVTSAVQDTGVLPKAGENFRKEYVQPALDFGQSLLDRYGSPQKAWNTLVEDPAGVAVDVAGLKPKANLAQPVEAGVKKVGSAIAGVPGKAADIFVQSHEGIGPGAVGEVVKAGREGNVGVRRTISEGANYEDILNRAETAVDKLRETRSNEYNKKMAVFEGADRPVDFDKIDRALGNVDTTTQYRGKSGIAKPIELRGPNEIAARDKINAAIEEWRNADPREFHTAYGFDKLKQKISNIMNDISPTDGMYKPLHVYGGKVLDAVKDTIKDVAPPEYVQAMEEYSNRTDQLRNVIKEFKLGPKNTDIQAVKSLQKIYRRTADVAHGEKENLLRKALEDAGDTELMQHLAGAQFHPWTPQGLRGLGVPATVAGVLGGALTPWALPLIGAVSPRVTGVTAYNVGRGAHLVDRAKSAYEKLAGGPSPYPGVIKDAITAPIGALSTPAPAIIGRESLPPEPPPEERARGGTLRRLERY